MVEDPDTLSDEAAEGCNIRRGFDALVVETEGEFVDAVPVSDIVDEDDISLTDSRAPYEGCRTPQVGDVWKMHPVLSSLRRFPGDTVEIVEVRSYPDGTPAGCIAEVVQVRGNTLNEKGDRIRVASEELEAGQFIRQKDD